MSTATASRASGGRCRRSSLRVFWFVLFTVGGWMMAQLAHSSDFGAQVKFITSYSLFSAFWLAWILATVSQFAINDGNYYESVNAGQNLIGAWRHWHRWLTCLAVAGGGVIAAWLVNFHFINGWFKVAGFLAVSVPCATVIMAVDHFLLPRLFRISRPLTKVPAWSEAGAVNVPAVVALLGAVAFGVTGTANWPNGWIYASEPNGWGPVPVEAWAALRHPLCRRRRGRPYRRAEPEGCLGFARFVRDEEIADGSGRGHRHVERYLAQHGRHVLKRPRRCRRGRVPPRGYRRVRRSDRARRRRGRAGWRGDRRLRRFAVVPGMVNAHNHSNENWFRGTFDNLPLEPWMLFSYPALAAPVQSAREIYVRTLLGAHRDGSLGGDERRRLPLRECRVHRRIARGGRPGLPRSRVCAR